eukprot:365326-Chlamydomonas_euryale.AAC.20
MARQHATIWSVCKRHIRFHLSQTHTARRATPLHRMARQRASTWSVCKQMWDPLAGAPSVSRA